MAILSFAISVILISVATTKIATEILLFFISLNSLIPVVKTENNRNTEVLIMTAETKPINKYKPE